MLIIPFEGITFPEVKELMYCIICIIICPYCIYIFVSGFFLYHHYSSLFIIDPDFHGVLRFWGVLKWDSPQSPKTFPSCAWSATQAANNLAGSLSQERLQRWDRVNTWRLWHPQKDAESVFRILSPSHFFFWGGNGL